MSAYAEQARDLAEHYCTLAVQSVAALDIATELRAAHAKGRREGLTAQMIELPGECGSTLHIRPSVIDAYHRAGEGVCWVYFEGGRLLVLMTEQEIAAAIRAEKEHSDAE